MLAFQNPVDAANFCIVCQYSCPFPLSSPPHSPPFPFFFLSFSFFSFPPNDITGHTRTTNGSQVGRCAATNAQVHLCSSRRGGSHRLQRLARAHGHSYWYLLLSLLFPFSFFPFTVSPFSCLILILFYLRRCS